MKNPDVPHIPARLTPPTERDDIVSSRQRRFSPETQEVAEERTVQAKRLVGISAHDGTWRFFFVRPLD
jgi:hypothetical protein